VTLQVINFVIRNTVFEDAAQCILAANPKFKSRQTDASKLSEDSVIWVDMTMDVTSKEA
jgi:hypothetical protein